MSIMNRCIWVVGLVALILAFLWLWIGLEVVLNALWDGPARWEDPKTYFWECREEVRVESWFWPDLIVVGKAEDFTKCGVKP